MKIGIDARLINETGVGRYIRNLIAELSEIDKNNNYVVFVRDKFTAPHNRWEVKRIDIPWHSVKEQTELPKIFGREQLDMLHIPYFTIPIFYPGKFIVTMHDLTVLHFATGKATTLPLPLYWVKSFAYRAILEIGLYRASHIIAVSNTTREELMDHFALDERKISVIHEGVRPMKAGKRLIKEPYFLYVGNAYPHKNLGILLRAAEGKRVVVVGKEDLFYKRLPRSENVTFFGPANDSELASLYTHAIALVFPSLMEGFGLPALEAAVCGTPVICSDIPSFHEIIGPLGNYFNPRDVSALRALLEHPEILKKPSLADHQTLLKKYSWRSMAEETLSVYNEVSR